MTKPANIIQFRNQPKFHRKRIYIAGPMSGYDNFNRDAFNKADTELTDMGWVTVNPAKGPEEGSIVDEAETHGDTKLAIENGFNFREAYLWDCQAVIKGDAIYMLKGWEQSPGARGEHAIAVAMQKHYPEYEIIYE